MGYKEEKKKKLFKRLGNIHFLKSLLLSFQSLLLFRPCRAHGMVTCPLDFLPQKRSLPLLAEAAASLCQEPQRHILIAIYSCRLGTFRSGLADIQRGGKGRRRGNATRLSAVSIKLNGDPSESGSHTKLKQLQTPKYPASST